jgi:hypothetical protein
MKNTRTATLFSAFSAAIVIAVIIPVFAFAQVDPYLQSVSYAQAFNCEPGDGAWRLDEISQDAYGRYTDPYYYGYYDNGASLGYNQWAQSAYAYTEPLVSGSYNPYAEPVVHYSTGSDTYTVAASQLAAAESTVHYTQPARRPYVSEKVYQPITYTPTQQVQYAAAPRNTYAAPENPRPTCRLTPVYADNDTILLKWTTHYATTAFIDNGIGHVSLGSGSRVVTPNGSLTYTMTVVNEDGASSQCMGKIIMEGAGTATIPGTSTTTTSETTSGSSAAQATALGESAGQTVSNGLTTAANAAETTTNTVSGFFSGLSSGGSVWDKIRSVSLVAIVLIVILAIVVFIMRTMFGGGGEGGHH